MLHPRIADLIPVLIIACLAALVWSLLPFVQELDESPIALRVERFER